MESDSTYDKKNELFSKNSPIHVLDGCKEEKFSLSDRLKLFGYEQSALSLLERLLNVKNVSEQKLFDTDEINYLERMNLQLDIPRVYFLTEKSNGDVMKKFISLGYYEEIPSQHYTAKTMNIVAELGKVKAMSFLHERKCPWNESTAVVAAKNGHLPCLKYAH